MKLIALRCLVLAGGLLTGSAQTDTNASVPSVQIETVSLHEELLSETVDGFGSIVTSDEAMVDISFPRAGQIAELRVRVGERVRAGQTLIKIDADPSTLSSYERAVATLEFAKRELERSKSLFAQHLATNAQVAAAQKAFEDKVDSAVTVETPEDAALPEFVNVTDWANTDGFAELVTVVTVAP